MHSYFLLSRSHLVYMCWVLEHRHTCVCIYMWMQWYDCKYRRCSGKENESKWKNYCLFDGERNCLKKQGLKKKEEEIVEKNLVTNHYWLVICFQVHHEVPWNQHHIEKVNIWRVLREVPNLQSYSLCINQLTPS